MSLDSKRKRASPPFLNTSNDRHTWRTPCSTCPLSCSSSEAREPSHPRLTSLWLPWKEQVCVAPTCPAMVWKPPQWKYWGTKGPKKDKCKIARDVTLHCCHSAPLQPKNLNIYFLICKHLRQFISSVASVFSCGRYDLKYGCMPYWQQLSYSTALNGGYHSHPQTTLPAHVTHSACRARKEDSGCFWLSLSFTSAAPMTNFWWTVQPLGSMAPSAGPSGYC